MFVNEHHKVQKPNISGAVYVLFAKVYVPKVHAYVIREEKLNVGKVYEYNAGVMFVNQE